MSHDLGDVVPLSVTITDEDGDLADAGPVSVTITLPDGTAEVHGPVAPTSTGIYDYDYPSVQAGRHGVRWVATAPNAATYTDAFDVTPADSGAFISLLDAKSHIRKSRVESVDDEVLRGFVDAACRMITDRMGQVSPATVITDRQAVRGRVVLPARPVMHIVTVQTLPGLEAVPQADAAAGIRGWTLESPEGVVSVSGYTGLLRFTYRAGRSPLPANFRLAGLELIAHLWRGSQHNQGGGRPGLGESDAIAWGATSFAMPYRVMELLGLRKGRERDEPLVG